MSASTPGAWLLLLPNLPIFLPSIAMKVAPERLEETANRLSGYDFVTHNYARDHEYNLWFTVIERDESALKAAIERIEREVEYEDMLDLPVQKKFKIDVRFKIK